jgi:hypothetical protein
MTGNVSLPQHELTTQTVGSLGIPDRTQSVLCSVFCVLWGGGVAGRVDCVGGRLVEFRVPQRGAVAGRVDCAESQLVLFASGARPDQIDESGPMRIARVSTS